MRDENISPDKARDLQQLVKLVSEGKLEYVPGRIFDNVFLDKFPISRAQISSSETSVISEQKMLKEGKMWLLRHFPSRISSKRAFRKDAVFIKVRIGEHIFTCLAEADKIETHKEIVKHIKSIEERLNLIGIRIIALEILPLPRIPLFPFITTIDKFKSKIGQELEDYYFRSFRGDSEAIKSWYKDLITFRREIVTSKLNQLTLTVPYVMKPLDVFILYCPREKVVKIRFYTSERDQVEIQEVDVVPTDQTFKDLFELPFPRLWISEITRGNYRAKKIYEGWGHPYIAATLELKEKVKEFNKEQETSRYDADIVTTAKVRNWVSQEINEIREFMSKFPQIKERYLHWTQPIYNLTVFSKDAPKPGWRRSGKIQSYYYTGKENKIVSLEFPPETSPRIDELIKKVFPDLESEAKPFLSFKSDFLYYLIDKMGDY